MHMLVSANQNNTNSTAPMTNDPAPSYATPQSSAVPTPLASNPNGPRRTEQKRVLSTNKPAPKPATSSNQPHASDKDANAPRYANTLKRHEAPSSIVSTFIDLQGSASPLVGLEEPVGIDDDIDLMHDWHVEGTKEHATGGEVLRLSSEESERLPTPYPFNYRIEDEEDEAASGVDARPSPKPRDGHEERHASGEMGTIHANATGPKRHNSDESEFSRNRAQAAKSANENEVPVQTIMIDLAMDSGILDDAPLKEKESVRDGDKESETDRLRRTKRKRRHDSTHGSSPVKEARNEDAINHDTHTSHTELLGTN